MIRAEDLRKADSPNWEHYVEAMIIAQAMRGLYVCYIDVTVICTQVMADKLIANGYTVNLIPQYKMTIWWNE